jgi:methylenetetrahydrofolate--tRNA-(uracil-5-)-methyltransferase
MFGSSAAAPAAACQIAMGAPLKLSQKPVHVIGGGLAGSEAAWQIARSGVPVRLHEMRPVQGTPAHKSDALAELVCSNSFRSDDAATNAVGLLHEEMRRAGSLIMAAGDAHQVPAGAALAVDRDGFAEAVTRAIDAEPLIEIVRGEVAALPGEDWGRVIVATGPLTSPGLGASIAEAAGAQSLAFFDAIAPIVYAETIDMDIAWFQSRYDKPGPGGSGADYINCPMTREEYDAFIAALLEGDTTEFHDWEKDTPYFEGCLPIEVMAERGPETLRHGPMKPVGLTNPRDPGTKPHAVVQLRQDNRLATLFNIVGFQTKLKYGDQARIFRTIPSLGNAEFARLGGIHRNTYIDSPRLLDGTLRLKERPWLRFAGQITGVEGYIESAAIGLLAGRFAVAEQLGTATPAPPETTALGALLSHITGGHLAGEGEQRSFQPMNINFGLMPPIEGWRSGRRMPKRERTQERKRALTSRALADIDHWLGIRRDETAQQPLTEAAS